MSGKIVVSALVLALLAVPGAAHARPNILIVMTDDQAARGTMDVMPRTTRLIGERGTAFLEAHATTPSCCPSRASFFTGRYVHNHHVTSNTASGRLAQRTTVQYFLKRRGYRTALFGKYLNSWPFGKPLPYFDDYAHTTPQYEGASWNQNGRIWRNVQRYNTDVISTLAVKFIRRSERKDRKPWLAWLTPLAPHLPSTPAPRHQDAPLPPFPDTPALTDNDVMDTPGFLDNARGYPDMIDDGARRRAPRADGGGRDGRARGGRAEAQTRAAKHADRLHVGQRRDARPARRCRRQGPALPRGDADSDARALGSTTSKRVPPAATW